MRDNNSLVRYTNEALFFLYGKKKLDILGIQSCHLKQFIALVNLSENRIFHIYVTKIFLSYAAITSE